jgi:glycosyltransferase involved in cell wall biosynthesis
LSHEYPPFIYGGIGTFVQNLAEGLCKRGLKITVVSGYPVPSRQFSHIAFEEGKDAEINVIRFPYLNMPPRHTLFQLLNIRKLYETIKNIGADIIHGQGGSTFPALLNLRSLAPIVTTFHSSPKVEKIISACSLGHGGSLSDFRTYVIGYPIMSFIFRKELSNSCRAVAVSKTLMFELLEEMGEAYREKICAIHNGVDIETLDREYKNVGDDVEESDDTMLFVGRLFWNKGALNLIKLAHVFQKEKLDFKIIIHGIGPLFGRMRMQTKTLGLNNVELKGFATGAPLMKSFKRSKFVVIPSFHEACPMILLESMCLGKIPIMFDLPYAREFTMNGKYGILAKNVENMALKIKSIHEHCDIKHLQNEIRNYARKKYNMDEIAQKYYHLYREV